SVFTALQLAVRFAYAHVGVLKARQVADSDLVFRVEPGLPHQGLAPFLKTSRLKADRPGHHQAGAARLRGPRASAPRLPAASGSEARPQAVGVFWCTRRLNPFSICCLTAGYGEGEPGSPPRRPKLKPAASSALVIAATCAAGGPWRLCAGWQVMSVFGQT